MKFLAILLIFCAANCCFAIKRTTVCPTKEVVSDFDFENYMGEWFELEKYPFKGEENLKCVRTFYTLINSISFYFKYEYITGGGNENIGYLSFPDENPLRGILSLVYGGRPTPNYYILDTDYKNFSIVWSCKNLLPSKSEYKSEELAWVLSRTPNPNQNIKNLIKDLVEKNLDVSALVKTDQNAKLCGY